MADFNNIKKGTKKYFDKAIVTANNAVEATKRYAEKAQANQRVSSMYEQLGKACYMHETGQKDESMVIKMLVKQISEAKSELVSAQKKLNDVKSKKCGICGCKNPAGSKYCLECGNKLEKE